MTETPTVRWTHTETIQTRAVAAGLGQGEVDILDLSIAVEFRTVDPAVDVVHFASPATRMRDWVERYVAERDLGHSFDFAPTSDRLAGYLLQVFTQFSRDVAAVTVTRADNGLVTTDTARWAE